MAEPWQLPWPYRVAGEAGDPDVAVWYRPAWWHLIWRWRFRRARGDADAYWHNAGVKRPAALCWLVPKEPGADCAEVTR